MKNAKQEHGGKRKGAGRPATGHSPMRGLRMPDSLVSAVESWSKKQPDRPGFSEAVRQLLEYAIRAWK